jgi:hypothetical protein
LSRPTYLREVCWNETDVLCLQNTASAPAEADDPYRGKHVFDAIHTPPPLFHHADVRRFVADGGAASDGLEPGRREPTDQRRLLAAVDEGRNAGRNLLFVAGATGAGKSHMVRWLHAQYTETNKSALSIHVRRRDTDLVTVVRRLAVAFGQQGKALRKLVDDAEKAGASTTSAFLNTTLVSALSAYAREVADHSTRYSAQVLTPAQAALRESAGLAAVHHDPLPSHIDVIGDADGIGLARDWAELVRTQPAETALEEGLLSKMKEPDPEKRRVIGDDLKPLSTLPDADLAPRLLPLRDRLADSGVRDWIADALLGPKAMDFAVQTSGASIQAEALQNALRDALEGAARQQKRVVFFFEDWGSVTGVRSGLLEAFTSMDDIHTAVIADTTRELRKLQDNVADRSIAVFEIGSVSESFGLQLAGRALNAVRVGGANLYNSSEAGAPLSNKCMDCAFVRDCHRGFGSVEDEDLGPIGLFPLTPEAVRRALARDDMQRTPRAMIMGILRKAIEHTHRPLSRSEYPTTEVAAALAPDERQLDESALREIAATLGPERAPTAANVLLLYRDQLALKSLSPELAEAFDLPEFADTAGPPLPPPRCRECSEAPCTCRVVPPPPRGPSIPDVARDAERFGRQEAQVLGSSLRDAMYEYGVAGVGFGNGIGTRALLTKLGRTSESSFGLEGTRGPHVASASRSDASALRGLAWALKTSPPGSWREQDNGHRRRAAALNLAAGWTRAIDEELRSPQGRRQRASLLLPYLAALNAAIDPHVIVAGPADLLNLALAEVTPDSRGSVSANLRSALERRGLARQEFLADLAFVQGETGKVFGVDTSVIYQDLREQFAAGIRLPDAATLPQKLRAWGHAVSRTIDDARAELGSILGTIAQLPTPVPDEEVEEIKNVVRAIRGAIADLPGRLPDAELTTIEYLEQSLENAADAPPLIAFQDPGQIDAIQPLNLPFVLQQARDFRASLQPRAVVAGRTQKVIDTLRSHDPISVDGRQKLGEILQDLEQRTGVCWPLPDEESLRTSLAGGAQDGTYAVRLRAVEQAIRSKGRALELERLLEDATGRAVELLELLAEQEAMQAQARSLDTEPSPVKHPPAPNGADTIEHLRAGAISEWIARVQRQLVDDRTTMRVRWEQLKAAHKPANHWQIARLVGDEEAEAAFDEANRLYEGLGADVPTNASERLAQVRRAEQRAWNSLRSQRSGPALDLAVRIQEQGGWLALSKIEKAEILPLIGPDGDQTLRFEIRLFED